MILSRATIKEALEKNRLQITPFIETNLKEASYTFTLSNKLLKAGENQVLQTTSKPEYIELMIPEGGYVLPPNEFVLGFTKETLSLKNNYTCSLSVRGSCAQIGLNALLSDTFAEPDTDSSLALAIYNASNLPIRLFEGMLIVKGIFIEFS